MKLAIVMPPMASMPLVSGGGVERLCELFLRENELADEPFDITLISRLDDASQSISSKYPHVRFLYVGIPRSEPPANLFISKLTGTSLRHDYLRGVIKLLRGTKFDRLLLENCPEFAAVLAKKFKVSPILHAHSRFFGTDRKGWKRILSYVERYIFVSEFLKNEAVRCGVPENRCSVLYNCVDKNEFDPARFAVKRTEKRAQYGLCDDDLLGIFVGRLTPEKGALELVKALSHSEYKESKLRLLIVGSAQYGVNVVDDYRNELEVAAAKGRVIFIGNVKSASTARFFARADFAVVPSVFNEPAGLPVLEALSSGLPIIVTDSGGIPEYTEGLDDEVCTTVGRGLGFVGALTKAIDEKAALLKGDPDACERIAAAARSHAAKFDVCEYCSRLRLLLK